MTFASQNHAAGVRILCILLFEPLCNLYGIPAGVLRGSGHALYPALGACAFRIAWTSSVARHCCKNKYAKRPI